MGLQAHRIAGAQPSRVAGLRAHETTHLRGRAARLRGQSRTQALAVLHEMASHPAVLARVLNGYYQRMSDAITQHSGHVSTFVGDGILAYFGAFTPNPWQSDDAVRAALAMREALTSYNKDLESEGLPPLAIGIGLHRTSADNDSFPFPTWTISMPWMPADSRIEILTARDDTKSPSFFVEPRALAVDEVKNRVAIQNKSPDAAIFHHPLGVQRVTGVHLVSPGAYQPAPAVTYLEKLGVVSVQPGKEWLLELTFDDGKQGKSKDLRPDLPLVIRY